jgi:hypothetical protein
LGTARPSESDDAELLLPLLSLSLLEESLTDFRLAADFLALALVLLSTPDFRLLVLDAEVRFLGDVATEFRFGDASFLDTDFRLGADSEIELELIDESFVGVDGDLGASFFACTDCGLTAAGDLVRDTRLEAIFSLEDTEFRLEDGDSGTPFFDTDTRLVDGDSGTTCLETDVRLEEAGDSVRAFLDTDVRLEEAGDSGTAVLDTDAPLVEVGDSGRAFLDEYARLAEGDGRVDAFSSSSVALDDRFLSAFSAFAEFPVDWLFEEHFAAFFLLEGCFFAIVSAGSILYSTSSSLATSKVLDSSTSS